MSFILGLEVTAEVLAPEFEVENVDPAGGVEVVGAPELAGLVDAPELGEVAMQAPESGVLVVPLAGPHGPQGPQGPPGVSAPAEAILGTAATPVGGHRVVFNLDSLTYADCTDETQGLRQCYLTLGAIGAGAQGPVTASGVIDEPSWSWTPGVPLFVGTDGLLSEVIPSGAKFSRIVAWSETSTRIFFEPQLPIYLT